MRLRGVSLQIAVPFGLFVVLGSLALVVWLFRSDQRESQAAFKTLAESNVSFVARWNLKPNEGLAEALSEVLELDVRFVPHGEPITIAKGFEFVRLEAGLGVDAVFARERPGFFGHLLSWGTLLPLGVFWLLSLVLAMVISRKLVRPIRSLAKEVVSLHSTDGSASAFPGAGRDDEIGQLSRALSDTHGRLIDERSRREEGERAAMLGKMATGLAHEIRNPVAAVRLHAQLLKECDRCGDSAATIAAEADTVEGLVNQWMFLSKPEPPEKGAHDLADCLHRCLDALAPAADHAGVEVGRKIDSGLLADVDATRMGQAFRNIALNAIHAMPDGGMLDVVGRRSGSEVEILISDVGTGFSDEALQRYGELFFSTKEGGMGVGLSVSSEIVMAHGGKLTVSNRESGGAEVCIRIPANP